jgi:hypothetical protein
MGATPAKPICFSALDLAETLLERPDLATALRGHDDFQALINARSQWCDLPEGRALQGTIRVALDGTLSEQQHSELQTYLREWNPNKPEQPHLQRILEIISEQSQGQAEQFSKPPEMVEPGQG